MAGIDRIKNNQREKQLLTSRLLFLVTMMALCALVLIARLSYLQIGQFKKYQLLSNNNQLGIIPLPPPRGLIYDRNGVVLAENMPVYSLEIIPEQAGNIKVTINRLQQLLPAISQNDVDSFYKLKRQHRSFDSVVLKVKLTPKDVATFAVNKYQFPGVQINARLIRNYPLGSLMAHIIGFVGRINQSDLSNLDKKNYRATNFIGKVGIEKFYEKQLHGKIGYQNIEVNARGRMIDVADKTAAIPGEDIYLTIDSKLQIAAAQAMGTKRGAVVLINPNNGEILAMVSTPSYDPNAFVQGISTAEFNQLQTNPNRPLFNRAIRGQYPPASTIKPFIALGALERNVIKPSFSVYDPGWFKLSNASHIYRDYKRGGHGNIGLIRAITVSCDTYFYNVANKMGIQLMQDILSQFGFGISTQIDLGEELKGILPDKHWKIVNKKTPWYKGDTIITGIGQGFMLSTPLQLAHATAALAMQGRHYRPHLTTKRYNANDQHWRRTPILEEYPIEIKQKANWDIIAKAMQHVITSREGTGFRFGRHNRFTIAAKTGTAQVVSNKFHESKKYADIPENLRDHSLFIGYAPVNKPEVAIAVIVENDYIAPSIAKKVVNAYFDNKSKKT